jgi:hypothetical protein
MKLHRQITSTLLLSASITLSAQAVLPGNDASKSLPANSYQTLLGGEERSGSFRILPDAPEWQSFRYERTGFISMAVGAPLSARIESDQAVLVLAAEVAQAFGLPTEGLFIAQTLQGMKTITRLVEVKRENGVVEGAYLALTINSSGYPISVKGRGFGDNFEGEFKISQSEAVASALGYSSWPEPSLLSAAPVWQPIQISNGIVLRPAFGIALLTSDPGQRPYLIVDAESGDILSVENRVVYEQIPGEVVGLYHPAYPNDQQIMGAFPNQIVNRVGGGQVFTDSVGAFSYDVNPDAAPFNFSGELRGRWVNVNYEDGDDAAIALRVDRVEPFQMVWNRDNSRDDERAVYVQTNIIHAFWKRLDPGYRAMDRVILGVVQHGDNYANAFWNGQGMYFGDSQDLGNLALKADVVHHEYCHGVTGGIYPWNILPYEGESGALNEAWSDYFSCSLSNEPLMGENANGGGAMRNLDNNLIYPRDWFGEVHYDSRMVSAAMWHSREVLGREVSDSLFHFARYQLGNDFVEYFSTVLLSDDDNGDITDGTPHDRVLYQQFGRHGIGPGIIPKLVLDSLTVTDGLGGGERGNENRLYEPGEAIAITAGISRVGILYPPAAEHVTISVETDHPALTVETGSIDLGSMRVDDWIPTSRPLVLSISDDAQLSFAEIILTVSDSEYPVLLKDTLRIAIGTPKLLVVNDGNGETDRMPWYRSTLDGLEVIYSEFVVAEPQIALAEWLPLFENVIWFTGDAKSGFLVPNDRQLIQRFIEEGGNVILTGQSIAKQMRRNTFLRDYFSTFIAADSINEVYAQGVAGDLIGDSLQFLLLGANGAMNQFRPAAIEAVDNGIEMARWPRLDGHPGAAVRTEHTQWGSKTVFFSFGLEGVSGHGRTATRREVISRLLNWFGMELNVPDPISPTPSWFELGAPYPNPFNSTVTISYSLPSSLSSSLAIYDLSGRLVERLATGRQEAGEHSAVWNAGNYGTGLYFVRLQAGDMTLTQRALLVR